MFQNFRPTKLTIILILFFLFLLSVAVHYYPVIKKGHGPSLCHENLVLGKNLALTGKYSTNDDKGLILSSALIQDKGVPATTENKLSSLFYAQVFKIFGFNPELPVKISVVLFGLTGLISFSLVYRLFGLKLAVIFGLIFIFMPILADYSLVAGEYDLALLFFSLSLLFYFWNFKKDKKSYGQLFLAGIFFALAFLSRNAFLISFVPFVVFDLFKFKSWKRIVVLILPFIVLVSIFLVPDFKAGRPNTYLGSYFGQSPENLGWDAHCFPDPYTYYFERDEYVAGTISTAQGDVVSCLADQGYKLGFKQEFLNYLDSIKYYVNKFFRLIIFGGPIMLAFMLAGLVILKKKNKPLFTLFLIWFFVLAISLIYLQTSNKNHFLEIILPAVLMMSLGIKELLLLIKNNLKISDKKKYLVMISLVVAILGHLIVADKWLFHERYETNKPEDIIVNMALINKYNLHSSDVIATFSQGTGCLNYLTDRSFVIFDELTIKNLIKQNKLKRAFEEFGVTYVMGYSEELNQQIKEIDIKVIE